MATWLHSTPSQEAASVQETLSCLGFRFFGQYSTPSHLAVHWTSRVSTAVLWLVNISGFLVSEDRSELQLPEDFVVPFPFEQTDKMTESQDCLSLLSVLLAVSPVALE